MHKSKIPQTTYLRDLRDSFLAGAEGIEPSARGFGAILNKNQSISDSSILCRSVSSDTAANPHKPRVSEPLAASKRAAVRFNKMIPKKTFFEKMPLKC